ncbi:MAG: hypothetical protein CME32_31460 [Gimesia sp.]|nr:hypothetical protein [Gimesia sp.]
MNVAASPNAFAAASQNAFVAANQHVYVAASQFAPLAASQHQFAHPHQPAVHQLLNAVHQLPSALLPATAVKELLQLTQLPRK